jgi:predicted DNA-binding transcriptional regulator AlpA
MLGRFVLGRAMTDSTDWVKIPLMAKELGISTKTIYNWISVNKLFMPKSGYVSRAEAYEVWLQQQTLRTFHSYFQSQNVVRDAFGRFSSKP